MNQEGNSEAEGSVPQRENTQNSNSSFNSEAHLEARILVPGKSASELQRALHEQLLPTRWKDMKVREK